MFLFCLYFKIFSIIFNGDNMKIIKNIGIISIPLIVGLLTSLFVDNDLYDKINLPSIAPPSILFPIVWTILYILMGIILKESSILKNKLLMALQLFLNFIWVIAFFKFQMFLLSFLIIIILDISCFYTILTYYKYSKLSAYLLIPYLIWIVFASYLNWSIYLIN